MQPGQLLDAFRECGRIRDRVPAVYGLCLVGPTLFGVVEVDETWMNDPRGRKLGDTRKRPPQLYIAGAIQRGGKVRLRRVPDLKSKTLKGWGLQSRVAWRLRGGSPAPTLRSPRKPPCAVICPTTRTQWGFDFGTLLE